MGTELQKRGLGEGECSAVWNLTHPEPVQEVHRAYRRAGARVHLTNTFQANPIALRRQGHDHRLGEICRQGVQLARRAGARVVLGSVGPIVDPASGYLTSPSQFQDYPDRGLLEQVIGALIDADGFVLETCSSLQALAAVEFLYRRVELIESKPILLSLTYRRDAKGNLTTFTGHEPEAFARHARNHGVSALGVNCGRDIGPEEIVQIVARYRAVTDLPLFARLNAGTPFKKDSCLEYPHRPERMAEVVPDLLALGVCMIGGCCGTTPEHIVRIREQMNTPA